VRALLLGIAVGAAALAAIPAYGTAPGRNGQIVYARFPTLWTVGADGTGEHKLPWVKQSEASDPDWSPDGQRIAFDRCAVKCEIWTMNADGSNQHRIGPDCLRKAGPCQDRAFPSWSPDGRRIAFGGSLGAVRADGVEFAEIFVMTRTGAGVRRVTTFSDGKKPFSVDLQSPAWSPDGKQLVFEVWNLGTADPPNRRALFVVNVDGSDLRQLTPWSLNGGDSPDWSPDGSRILFRTISTSNRHHGNLYTVRPDGSGLTKLTNYPAPKTVLMGSFSPDGRWIVFSRFTADPYPAVYVMRSDGTSIRRVSSSGGAYEPDWGPSTR
jgi:Tol biopolymer transport system component